MDNRESALASLHMLHGMDFRKRFWEILSEGGGSHFLLVAGVTKHCVVNRDPRGGLISLLVFFQQKMM